MAISRVGEVILALCVVGACVFVYQEGARKVQEDPRLISWARGISPKAQPPLWGPRVKKSPAPDWKVFQKLWFQNRYITPVWRSQTKNAWLDLWKQKTR